MLPLSPRTALATAVLALAASFPISAPGFDGDGGESGGESGAWDWSGRGELGLASASGNTDSQTLIARLDLGREDERDAQALGATFQYGRSDGRDSAYRYELSGNLRHQFHSRSHMSASLRHQRDHFATNEYQWALAVGFGLTLMEEDDDHLRVEIGPGYRFAKLQDVRVHKNEAIVRGHLDFARRLSKTTSIYDTFLIEAGQNNTYARNDLGVQVQVSKALALKAGIEVRHNTEVLPGRERTDTLTTVNLVYGF